MTVKEIMSVLSSPRLLTRQDSGAYRLCNPHNPDLPLGWSGSAFYVRHSDVEDCPVTGVSFFGAEVVATAVGGRLPTVWEWRAAALADTFIYPWGNEPPDPGRANYGGYIGRVTSVHRYPPSVAGFFDLAGNVGEWCCEEGDLELIGSEDALWARVRTEERPVCGGGWNKPREHLRSLFLRKKWARIGTVGIGFRVVFEQLGAHTEVSAAAANTQTSEA